MQVGIIHISHHQNRHPPRPPFPLGWQCRKFLWSHWMGKHCIFLRNSSTGFSIQIQKIYWKINLKKKRKREIPDCIIHQFSFSMGKNSNLRRMQVNLCDKRNGRRHNGSTFSPATKSYRSNFGVVSNMCQRHFFPPTIFVSAIRFLHNKSRPEIRISKLFQETPKEKSGKVRKMFFFRIFGRSLNAVEVKSNKINF